jgi:protein-tyrosine phosphatase
MKKNILFVCHGNICRSPSAEAVFKGLVKFRGVSDKFRVDSAGISDWYVGEPADKRMQYHAIERGYYLDSTSRLFDPDTDFDSFDMIIAMDDENVIDLESVARSPEDFEKIHKITDFRKNYNYLEIPDPYYGGEEGFELVLDLLEDACTGLLEELQQKRQE